MNSLSHRAISTLPLAVRALVLAHAHKDEIDDLVQQCALVLLQDPHSDSETVFARARSATRRFTQDPAHYAVSAMRGDDDAADEIDAISIDDVAQAATGRRGGERAALAREVAARRGVTVRRAQQLVARQVERAAVCGDLFAEVAA